MSGRVRATNSSVTCAMSVVVATRRMKRSAASAIPTSTACVRSAKTVSARVTGHTLASVRLVRKMSGISAQSPMFHATISRIAASTGIGTSAASGAAHSTMPSSISAWTMPATGVFAPERTLVAVRAIAPVAGRPPKSGEAMLATPCATSSTFGLWRSPVMRSATTADISDSMPPSIATVNAGGRRPSTRSRRNGGNRERGQPLGMPWKRVSMVSTSRPSVCAAAVPATSATIVPGTRVFSVAQRISASSVHTPSAGGRRRRWSAARGRSPPCGR